MTFLRKLAVGGAMALPMLLALPAGATTFEATGFVDLVQSADAVVVGSVLGERTETRDGQVYTITDFDVSDVAFGRVGGTVSVATPGGAIPNSMFPVTEVVPGAPRFLSGQTYMLVLDAAPTSWTVPSLGGIGGPIVNRPQVQRGRGADFTVSGMFRGALPLHGNQVSLPEIGSDLALDEALRAVSEVRTERRAPGAAQQLEGETK